MGSEVGWLRFEVRGMLATETARATWRVAAHDGGCLDGRTS